MYLALTALSSALGVTAPLFHLIAAKFGSKLGLYNHGGWGGEPKNLVSVCKEFTGLANGSRTLYVGNNSYSGSSDGPGTVNPNNSDEGRIQQTSSTFIAFEIAI